jgi:hypothetical protein
MLRHMRYFFNALLAFFTNDSIPGRWIYPTLEFHQFKYGRSHCINRNVARAALELIVKRNDFRQEIYRLDRILVARVAVTLGSKLEPEALYHINIHPLYLNFTNSWDNNDARWKHVVAGKIPARAIRLLPLDEITNTYIADFQIDGERDRYGNRHDVEIIEPDMDEDAVYYFDPDVVLRTYRFKASALVQASIERDSAKIKVVNKLIKQKAQEAAGRFQVPNPNFQPPKNQQPYGNNFGPGSMAQPSFYATVNPLTPRDSYGRFINPTHIQGEAHNFQPPPTDNQNTLDVRREITARLTDYVKSILISNKAVKVVADLFNSRTYISAQVVYNYLSATGNVITLLISFNVDKADALSNALIFNGEYVYELFDGTLTALSYRVLPAYRPEATLTLKLSEDQSAMYDIIRQGG